jgi:hypothetical protein
MRLSREGIICGPSSGLCIQGLLNFLAREKAENGLSRLPRTNGIVHCVFFCCDLPYQYLGDYFDKLGESSFRPIVNEVREQGKKMGRGRHFLGYHSMSVKDAANKTAHRIFYE